jgi:hypothetical protein
MELELSYNPAVLGLAWRWQAVFGYGGSWTGMDRWFCGCGVGLVGAEVTLVLNKQPNSRASVCFYLAGPLLHHAMVIFTSSVRPSIFTCLSTKLYFGRPL